MNPKKPSSMEVIKTEVVCPSDANPMGLLQGGRLVQWMDIAAAVCAQTHAEKICVTAAINQVQFYQPAHVGDIITIKAIITRSFTTSMEIVVEAYARKVTDANKHPLSKAYFTFVALNEKTKPAVVPAVKPVSKKEKDQYRDALKRKVIAVSNKRLYS